MATPTWNLYTASDRAAVGVVEDLRADGLRSVQRKGEPFDIYTRRGGEALPFDGEWKRQKLSEQSYMDAFRHAETVYGDLLKVLIAELQASSARNGPVPVGDRIGCGDQVNDGSSLQRGKPRWAWE